MEFEWDAQKALANLRKHGVSFEEATTAFADLLALRNDDPYAEDEQREITVAMSERNRVLVVVSVERSKRVRVISARRATRKETELYEQAIREKLGGD